MTVAARGVPMTEARHVRVGEVEIGNDLPLVLIAGPCALESRAHALEMSRALKEMASALGIGLIYKTSFDKANRSSLDSPRGVGLDQALPIFAEIREAVGLPVLTDVHAPEQCAVVAAAADVLQIPAFLCRQTDLLVAAARTVLVCERGASFGYNTLVSDLRALPILARTGCPVVFDATHSVQQPGGQGTTSGGQREFVPVLARAAVAAGVAAVFMETHQDPDRAPSDGPNMVPLKEMPELVRTLIEFDRLAKARPAAIE
jgi:2-dehydro-3-deoxyphosphooctonate aldolase (KDO 8-P synthase)